MDANRSMRWAMRRWRSGVMRTGGCRAVVCGAAVLLLLLEGMPARGQSTDEVAVLAALRRAAVAGESTEAYGIAGEILASAASPGAHRVAALLGGQAAGRLGRGDEAQRLLEPELMAWPHDSDWAAGVIAYVELLTGRGYWFRATQWAIALAAVEPERAAELIAAMPAHVHSNDELHYLGWQASTSTAATCAVLGELAGRAPQGSALAAELVSAGLHRCGEDAGRLAVLQRLAPGALPARLGFYDIGVVCPFNGRYARYGEALAQGAVLAVEEVNTAAPFPLRVRVLDSRGEPLTAAREAALAALDGVGALLGDLLTPATISAAAAAAASATPLVSPAATRAELGTIGPLVFQTIVPRETQAEALARMAVGGLGIERIAILHPDTQQGADIARRFARVATRGGAEIISVTPYPEEQTNFALELEPLAELLPEAVFIPGAPRELMAIVPQFSYYEVDTRVLALEELGLSEVLQATGDYLDGAIFSNGYYRVPAARLDEFRRRYRARYGQEPDPYATRGYVAMSILAGTMQSGARNRGELSAALARRVVRFGRGDARGILQLGQLEGEVALFQADGSRISPLE